MFYLLSSTWRAKMRSSMNQRVWPAVQTVPYVCYSLQTLGRVRQQHKTGVREQSGKKNNIKTITTSPASSSFLLHANHIPPHNATQNKSETFVCPRPLLPRVPPSLPQKPFSLFYYYDFLEDPAAKWSTCSSMSQPNSAHNTSM